MLIRRRSFLKSVLGATAALAMPLPRVPESPAPPVPALVLPDAPALVVPERRLWALDRTMVTPGLWTPAAWTLDQRTVPLYTASGLLIRQPRPAQFTIEVDGADLARLATCRPGDQVDFAGGAGFPAIISGTIETMRRVGERVVVTGTTTKPLEFLSWPY